MSRKSTNRDRMLEARKVARAQHAHATCGLCGTEARHIGSHVLDAHADPFDGPDALRAILREEREARHARRIGGVA